MGGDGNLSEAPICEHFLISPYVVSTKDSKFNMVGIWGPFIPPQSSVDHTYKFCHQWVLGIWEIPIWICTCYWIWHRSTGWGWMNSYKRRQRGAVADEMKRGGWSEAIPSETLGVDKWAKLEILETADTSSVYWKHCWEPVLDYYSPL